MKKVFLPLGLIIFFTAVIIGVLLLIVNYQQEESDQVQSVNITDNDNSTVFLKNRDDIYKYHLNLGEMKLAYSPEPFHELFYEYTKKIGDVIFVKEIILGVEENIIKANLATGERQEIYTSDLKFNFIVTNDEDVYVILEDDQLIHVDKNRDKEVLINDLKSLNIEKSDLDIKGVNKFLSEGLINNKYIIIGGYTFSESALLDITKKGDDMLVKSLPDMYYLKPLEGTEDTDEIVYAVYNEENNNGELYKYLLNNNNVELLLTFSEDALRIIDFSNGVLIAQIGDSIDKDLNKYEAGEYSVEIQTGKVEKFQDVCSIYNYFEGPCYSFSEDSSKAIWVEYLDNNQQKLVIADYNDIECFSSLKKYDLPEIAQGWNIFDYKN